MVHTTTLTEEQKRVKIAEALGWTHDTPDLPTRRGTLWVNPQGRVNHECGFPNFPSELPDYFHDLNACAEMRKALTPEQGVVYITNLYHRVVPVERQNPGHFVDWEIAFMLADATANDQIESFAATLHLW